MNLLLLGGTTEASALARALAGGAWRVTLSLAGRTRRPAPQPVPCRVGGFGGVDGLVDYLQVERIDVLVDATHPFATQMTRHAAAAAIRTGTALLRIDRPAWTKPPGAIWDVVETMPAAAASIGDARRKVLLTVGQQDLGPFAAAPRHDYVVRSVDPPAAPPAGAIVLTATGPFRVEDERALMLRHGIEVLVTKNAGGSATAAKLHAAASLGVRTIVVARPAQPAGIETVPDPVAALAWLDRQAGTRRSE